MDVVSNSLIHICRFLADHRTLTLATIGPDGQPQAADLYYVPSDELALYFISVPRSRHAVNVARDPHVAATIHADSSQWHDIRGVQLEGTCVRVTGPERLTAWARYTARFPFVLTDVALAGALQKVDLYRIIPYWLRWIDNSSGLGHNPEWQMTDGEWQLVSPKP